MTISYRFFAREDDMCHRARQLSKTQVEAFFSERKSVCTIGAFDGVHLGHQQLLHRVVGIASIAKLRSCVVLFEPQPNEFFYRLQGRASTSDATQIQQHKPGLQAPSRLMSLREKLKAIFAAGIDSVLCLHFNESLRAMSAQAFAKTILHKLIHVDQLIIGDDFQFGKDREGDFSGLKKLGSKYQFSVEDSSSFELTLADANLHTSKDAQRVSSTRIRCLLQKADLRSVKRLLGRDYSLCGRVVYGNQVGRKLGFPTANVRLKRDKVPLAGVFAVSCDIYYAGNSLVEEVKGIANVGNRPTVDGHSAPILEVHLLNSGFSRSIQAECDKGLDNAGRDQLVSASLDNYALEVAVSSSQSDHPDPRVTDRDKSVALSNEAMSTDIYGCFISTRFLKFIRAEKKFDSLDELRGQINQDVKVAKEFHGLR